MKNKFFTRNFVPEAQSRRVQEGMAINMEKKKIIINTDLGDDVDDSVAIALALQSPEIEIIGITTVFKHTKARANMVKDLLEYYGRQDIPVYIGQGMPMIERQNTDELPIQYEIIRKSYDLDIKDEAVEFIIKTITDNPQVYFVEMGPQTNLALAFLKAPQIMKQAKIIGMGGAFLNSYPEWNIKCDPEAARIVTDFAEQLILFGLDVTKYCGLSKEQWNRIEGSDNEKVQYLCKGMQTFVNKTGLVLTFHDVLLILYLIDESLVTLKQGDYTVELKGELTRGTILHKTNYYELVNEVDKSFYYAVDFNRDEFWEIVMDRVFS